jgi:putative nucleotidyltransferase with HDIG domain
VIPTEDILAKVDALPTLPTAVSRLSALLQDETTSAKDFEDVIAPDPALTANLLRMANSAYFGMRREVESVGHAVTVMGTKRVFEVAAGASFSKTIPSSIPGYEIDADRFWQHCIAVAILSERLSVELGVKTPALTFTSGMLHDIGKLAIGSFLLDDSTEILEKIRNGEMEFVAAEREVLGSDHAEVGATIADKWDLPESIGAAARWHHAPEEAPSDVDQTLVDLVHAADGLAHSLGYGADVGELSRSMDRKAIERLGIKVQRLEMVACDTLDEIRQVGEVFAPSGGNGR